MDSDTLSGRVAAALSESEAAQRAIEAAPARRRQPALILAALHDLALAGRAPELAAAYAAADPDAAAAAAIDTLVAMADEVAHIAARRKPRTGESRPCAVLYPAIAEAAHRAGADAVGLIDAGGGLNLIVDRVGIAYRHAGPRERAGGDDVSPADGPMLSLGDPASPVQLSAAVVGDGPVPARALPEIVARIGIDADPLDVTDPDDVRWLRACVPPDQPERAARLEAEIAVAATAPPRLLRGDAVELLPDAFAQVPADSLPVVITTWALARLSLERRLRFLHRLEDAAAGRTVAWVSVEGVGVAPAIPTLGDRRAFGHSTIGLALLDRATVRAEAVGRCWSQGRWLSWLSG